MGVHGLWDLLAPVGRRVSVETLAGKKLAIDASIWLVQFMKAMRDEKGDMVRNAHLLGFFRRICKLLYLRTKPVFVFDGGTPALKRRTVIARRRQRENAKAKIRKTAEKLLLNQLKTMRLKELANNLEKQKQKKDDGSNDKDLGSENRDYEKLDEMLAASIAAEDDGTINNNASTSAVVEEMDSDEDEEMILPGLDENVDPTVFAALPPSMQLELLMRQRSLAEEGKRNPDEQVENLNEKHKNNGKGKEILSDQMDKEGNNLGSDHVAAESYNREELDEMLAASMVTEEEGGDEDEEMILPHGKVDPAVLASLPPSMQLDLLVQMRERLMAENRQRYQKVKKVPEKFSELQIQAYLKTVAFRREIDQVQKAAAGNGLGGVQASRIASESNREFIFSSSFSGDKQLLTSAGVKRKKGDEQQKKPVEQSSSDFVAGDASSKSYNVTGLVMDKPRRAFDDDVVETYLDERGRVRVSRVRAMGIRMTRDLQRNLDLMKEIEKENMVVSKNPTAQSVLNISRIGSPNGFPRRNQHGNSSHGNSGNSVNLEDSIGKSFLNNETSMEICFEVGDGSKSFDNDDDIFASLVAGKPVSISTDSDWEEGIIEAEDNSFPNNKELRTEHSLKVSDTSDDSAVEWEEGDCYVHEKSSYPAESRKPVSRGRLEEEADLQEAIRRSLKDLEGEAFSHSQPEHENVKISEENPYEGVGLLDEEDNVSGPNMLVMDCTQQNKSSSEILGPEKLDDVGEINNISQAFSSSGSHIKSSEPNDPETGGIFISESCERYLGSYPCQLSEDVNKGKNLCREMPSLASGGPLEEKEIHLSVEQASNIDDASHSTEAASGDLPHAELIDERNDIEAGLPKLVHEEKISSEAEPSLNSVDITNSSVLLTESFPEDSANASDFAQKLDGGKKSDDYSSERKCREDKYALMDDEYEQFDSIEAPNYDENEPVDSMEASVEKEMLILGEEYMNLGDEQRKLERNAESVSTEMFAECQELLQMFGIPYIIAPMEAEAQCAYMELANLVDGVVTDDSDVFLFGAQSVYKNIFDDRKYVETYFMKDIEKELGLTREKLICMALLLGSDYTEGISGIGIVNAIEVVTAFPEEDGLQKFREWIESPDPAILGKVDVQTGLNMRKKGSKAGDSNMNSTNNNKEGTFPSSLNIAQAHEEKQSAAYIQEIKQTFMDKHRNVSKNWHIPPSFPSQAVISAYSCPQVDKSTESFTWGKPDLHVLHRLCWEKFGWGIQKSDELLLPVLKEYDKHETQLRLEAFYTFNERFAKIRSKRIKKAVKGITKAQSSDIMDDSVEEASKSRRPSRNIGRKSGKTKYEKPSQRTAKNAPGSKSNSMEKSNPKQSRKRTAEGPILCDVENTEASVSGYMDRGSLRSGKGRGRGTGRGIERGRGKRGPSFEQSTSGSDDFESGDNGHEVPVEESGCLHELRRSARSRKPISYSVDDLEIDNIDKSLDRGDSKGFNKLAADQCLSCAQEVQRDDAAGVNGNEQHKVGDSSLQSFSSDYLERGGFCTNGEGVGLPVVSQNSSPPKDDVPSNDYLKMGGGFCVDESEEGIDPDAAVQETGDSSKSGGFGDTDHGKERLNELQRDGGKKNASDSRLNKDGVNVSNTNDDSTGSVSVAENNKDNSGASGLRGLCAIPFLKRKRRKG